MKRLFTTLLLSALCFAGNAQDAPRTLMIILDGLASGAADRIPLPYLQELRERGTYYREVHLPLPAHPEKSATYPWSCSLPNPALMSGTVFIGQEGIREQLIQHAFGDQTTAFVVNDGAYRDVAGGFDIYRNLRKTFADLFRDEMVFDTAKAVLQQSNPSFMRIHLQGPGSAGHRSREVDNLGEPWYGDIWHPESPYTQQMRKADSLLAEFVGWLEAEGYLQHTTLMILGDHGQAPTGAHPPYHPASSKTELLIMGPGIRQGATFAYAEITDLVPTIAHLHGLAPPRYAAGRVLSEAFVHIPVVHAESRPLEELNLLLLRAQLRAEQGVPLPEGFPGILQISTWHEGLPVVEVPALAERIRRMLEK